MAEPNRKDYPELRALRELLYTDLSRALALGLRTTLQHVRERERPEDRVTAEALAWAEKVITL